MIPHSVTAASKVSSEPESVNRIKEGVDDPEKGLLARRLTDFFVEETGHFHNRAPYASSYLHCLKLANLKISVDNVPGGLRK